jgi:hypothetical protein
VLTAGFVRLFRQRIGTSGMGWYGSVGSGVGRLMVRGREGKGLEISTKILKYLLKNFDY